jgi:transcription elongation factor
MAHEDLIEALRRMPGVLAEFLREVPEEELHRQRGEGIWTLYEHLEHLVTVQDVLHRRLQLIRDADHPEITPYTPEEEEPAGAAATGGDASKDATGSWRSSRRPLPSYGPSRPSTPSTSGTDSPSWSGTSSFTTGSTWRAWKTCSWPAMSI